MGYTGFICPDCGGYKWGTSHCTESKDKWIGHCHGGNHRGGCGFTWHRMTDDEKRLGIPLTPDEPVHNAEHNRRPQGVRVDGPVGPQGDEE